MNDLVQAASKASGYIEQLATEMFEGGFDNNHMLLGSLSSGKDLVQVQLVITRNQDEFLDE